MKNIRIEYPFLYFFQRVKEIQVPEGWLDLTPKQFKVCANAHIEQLSDVSFLVSFYGLKKSLVKKLTKFEHYKLIELVEFVSSPKALVNYFYLKEIPGTGLLSPEKALRGISLEHFMLFDTFFFDYLNSKKDEDLIKFVAALFLKKKEKVTSINFTRRNIFITENVDKSTLYAIFLNYIFIRKWLSKAYPLLFGFREKDDEEVEDKRNPKKQMGKTNRPDWIAILDGFVGDDVVNHDKYKVMPCTLVFRLINKRIATYNKYAKK